MWLTKTQEETGLSSRTSNAFAYSLHGSVREQRVRLENDGSCDYFHGLV